MISNMIKDNFFIFIYFDLVSKKVIEFSIRKENRDR